MAYRRKTRRRKAGKRRTNRRLSAHMVRAIRAIAQGPVETKYHSNNYTMAVWLTGASYAGGPEAVIRQPLWAEIPRFKNTSTKTEHSFIGNEIMSRGFRWELHLNSLNSTALGNDIQFRWTVYKDPLYGAAIGVGPSDRIFNQDFDTTSTRARWNTQAASIIFQRHWSWKMTGQVGSMHQKKFYVKMRRKLTAVSEESTVVNTYLGETKGGTYYWVLEAFSYNTSNLSSQFTGYMSTQAYFKDA